MYGAGSPKPSIFPRVFAMLSTPDVIEHSYGESLVPVSDNGGSEPHNHPSWRGNSYQLIPTAFSWPPTISNGSDISKILTISPKEIVMMAK